jgi:hypothetical protein
MDVARAKRPQRAHGQRGAGGAIGIEIAQHQNPLVPRQRFRQQHCRGVHSRQFLTGM